MTTIGFSPKLNTISVESNGTSNTVSESPCRVSACVFSYFLSVCEENPNSRLFSLNKVETSLNSILLNPISASLITGLCGCLTTNCDSLVHHLINCIAADNLLVRRASTRCLYLLSRLFVPYASNFSCDFISFIVTNGLSQNVPHHVKLALCTAIPQIFSADLFETCIPAKYAQDFSPLLRSLITCFINTNGSKSPFKYAFVSMLKVFGADVYNVIEDRWKIELERGIFPSSYFQLSQRWTGNLFRSKKHNGCPSVGTLNGDSIYRLELSASRESFQSTESAILENSSNDPDQNVNQFSYLSDFVSRQTFECLSNSGLKNSGSPKNAIGRNNLNTYLAIEELRDSVNLKLDSLGWRTLFFPNHTNKSHTYSLSIETTTKSNMLTSLMELLHRLLQDTNFNVTVCCIDLTASILDAFNKCDFQNDDEFRQYWSQWLSSRSMDILRTAFSDNKLVVRVAGSKLAQSVSRLPEGVSMIIERLVGRIIAQNSAAPAASQENGFERVTKNLMNTNVRLCQELIDLSTSLLLTMPSSKFNMKIVCHEVIRYGLISLKPSVRVATLDCIAVVAHILGPGNLQPLLHAVSDADQLLTKFHKNGGSIDAVENSTEALRGEGGGGIWEAVQRRLARRQLPQLDNQSRVIRGFTVSNSIANSVAAAAASAAVPVTPSPPAHLTHVSNSSSNNNTSCSAVISAAATTTTPHLTSLYRVPCSGHESDRNGEGTTIMDLEAPIGVVPIVPRKVVTAANYPRRRPSASSSRNSQRLPWYPGHGSAYQNHSVASSSGVSSAASPRGLESHPDCSSADLVKPFTPSGWPVQRGRLSSRVRVLPSQADSACDLVGSHSLPSSGRISPILSSTQPIPFSVDRTANQMRGARGSVSSGVPHPIGSQDFSQPDPALSTPRRRPLLAPLRYSKERKNEPPTDQSSIDGWMGNNPTTLGDTDPAWLPPTRAAMGRQSGRSWKSGRSSNQIQPTGQSSGRFGFSNSSRPPSGTAPPSSNQTTIDRRIAGGRPSRSRQSTSRTETTLATDRDSDDPEYDDDYEDVEDVDTDIVDDDNDEEEDDEDSDDEEEALSAVSQRNRAGRSTHRPSKGRQQVDTRLVGLHSGSASLCRSMDSELSELSSIRSAASHRRAMRLFEEAERKRLAAAGNQDEESPTRRISDAVGDSSEPCHVSTAEANCPVPVLAPAVVPALPLRRAFPGKASAKRRSILANHLTQSPTGALSASASDLKPPTSLSVNAQLSADSSRSGSATSPLAQTKYNPYTGASFRTNPDYSVLVVGRATGVGGNAVAGTGGPVQLSSTPDLHRMAQGMHFGGERRPLKGQHNIHSGLLPSSLGTSPQNDNAASVAAISSSVGANTAPHSSSTINVVGRGLFDSQPTLPASTTQANGRCVSESVLRHGRSTPFASNDAWDSSAADEQQSIKPNVLSFGSGDAGHTVGGSGFGQPAESIESPQVSNNSRQRALQQKKSKELLKLRKSATGTPSKMLEQETAIDPRLTHELDELGDHAPSTSTWPPGSSGTSSKRSSIYDGTQRKATLPPKQQLPPAASRASKAPAEVARDPGSLSRGTRSGSHVSLSASGRSRSPSAETGATPFQRVQSTGCLNENNSTVEKNARTTDTGKRVGGTVVHRSDSDRPLLKGRSSLNFNATCPTLPVVLQLMSSTDWEAKFFGLEGLSQIAVEKPSTFCGPTGQSGSASAGSSRQASHAITPTEALNQAVQAVITECRNLRSQVCRQAVQTLSCLFHGLGRHMDPHVELSIRVLLGKTGESAGAFLRDEVSVAMEELIQAANPARVMNALMQHGLGHKNAEVRLQTALQMSRIVENLTQNGAPWSQASRSSTKPTSSGSNSAQQTSAGSTRGLTSWGSTSNLHQSSSGNPSFLGNLMDRLVTALSQFLTDGNQETRYYGRRLLKCLHTHPDFERLMRKQLTGQTYRAVRDALDLVQTKGVGEPPSASAGSRRRGYSPAAASRGTSAGTTPQS